MKQIRRVKYLAMSVLLIGCYILSGCSSSNSNEEGYTEIEGLVYKESMDIEYAQNFSVDYYNDGYALIDLVSGDKFLVVPEGKEVPANIPSSMTVLKQPIEDIYLVATAEMCSFVELDALSSIRLTGTRKENYSIPEAVEEMEEGNILYAGKYSEPDYELLLSEGCSLSIQSTMIYHKPEVQEKLEELGINVLVDLSSSESHPLGRTEWIKLYSVLLDKEDIAYDFFDTQIEIMERLENVDNAGISTLFFYVNSTGGVVARNSDDYVTKMIQMAGGNYIFENLGDPEKNNSTTTIGMEELYASGKDADLIFYNGTIDNSVKDMEDLLDKSDLFLEFKAVKEGNVWGTNENIYQSTTKLADVTWEIYQIISGVPEDEMDLMYFYKID